MGTVSTANQMGGGRSRRIKCFGKTRKYWLVFGSKSRQTEEQYHFYPVYNAKQFSPKESANWNNAKRIFCTATQANLVWPTRCTGFANSRRFPQAVPFSRRLWQFNFSIHIAYEIWWHKLWLGNVHGGDGGVCMSINEMLKMGSA